MTTENKTIEKVEEIKIEELDLDSLITNSVASAQTIKVVPTNSATIALMLDAAIKELVNNQGCQQGSIKICRVSEWIGSDTPVLHGDFQFLSSKGEISDLFGVPQDLATNDLFVVMGKKYTNAITSNEDEERLLMRLCAPSVQESKGTFNPEKMMRFRPSLIINQRGELSVYNPFIGNQNTQYSSAVKKHKNFSNNRFGTWNSTNLVTGVLPAITVALKKFIDAKTDYAPLLSRNSDRREARTSNGRPVLTTNMPNNRATANSTNGRDAYTE